MKQIGVGDIQLGPLERKYLKQVIDSSRLSYGPMSKDFEKRMAEAHDSKFAVFCNSGTSALLVALQVLKEKYGWSDGDEVIVPATTFIATSNIVLQSNMIPVFVDADPNTYNIDPRLIEEKITTRTRCIIPAHLFGMPCDMDPIMSIARKYDLRVIEDSCETMFANYKGKKVGSFGDFSCFSTYVAHFLVTGVGGLIMTSDPDLAIMARSMCNHGRDSIYLNIDDDKDKDSEALKEVIAKRFSFVRMGHSFRATEFEAAVGLGQFEQRHDIISWRRRNAAFFSKHLSSLSEHLILPFVPEGVDHNFMMYPIMVRSGNKASLLQFLEERGIETRDMPTVIAQPYYQELFGDIVDKYPVTKSIIERGFYIGTHQYISYAELQHVLSAFYDFYNTNQSV